MVQNDTLFFYLFVLSDNSLERFRDFAGKSRKKVFFENLSEF